MQLPTYPVWSCFITVAHKNTLELLQFLPRKKNDVSYPRVKAKLGASPQLPFVLDTIPAWMEKSAVSFWPRLLPFLPLFRSSAYYSAQNCYATGPGPDMLSDLVLVTMFFQVSHAISGHLIWLLASVPVARILVMRPTVAFGNSYVAIYMYFFQYVNWFRSATTRMDTRQTKRPRQI